MEKWQRRWEEEKKRHREVGKKKKVENHPDPNVTLKENLPWSTSHST